MRKVINEYEINEGQPQDNAKQAHTAAPQEHGASVTTTVGCLRGLLLGCIGLVLSVSGGLAVGSHIGVFSGIFVGLVLLVVSIGFTIYWTASVKTLTLWDCLLPLPLGVLSSLLFAPWSLLLNASVFSAVTCMCAALFLSMTLLLYRARKIDGKWLIFPFLVFVYEMLPIEFPSDLDNVLSFGGNIVNTIAAFSFSPVVHLGKEIKEELNFSPDENDDTK